MANSDIIKIGFDYRASLEQFEKETNGVFDGISDKAGKQKITIQLDAKDDKVIEKIKELQKLKLDKFTFEFGNSGLKEQLQTFDKLENKINEIISLSKGIDLSFNTKNKTEAYNQLKKYADVFKDYYGNEEAMATNAGAKAGYAYYKAYEEALRKGVAQSKLEKVTVDFDVNDSIFSKESIVENRIKEFENFQKYGKADESNLIAEITLLENRLLKFNSAYSQVKANLGDAPITPEITKNIEEYVRLLEIAENRAKDAELFGFSSEDINSDKDLANMYLDFAKEDATAENKKYIESLKEEKVQTTATAEAEQKLAEAQKETVSNTSNSNNSQIEELKSDIQEVKTELGDVRDRISSIESNGFENVREDVEKTKESVKELNSELTEMKSNLTSTPQESNISSGSNPATSNADAEIKANSEVIASIEKKKQELASYELQLEETRYELDKMSKSSQLENNPIKDQITLQDNLGRKIDENNSKFLQGTKALNEQKKVLTLFHFSNESFDKFDNSKAGKNGAVYGSSTYLSKEPTYKWSNMGSKLSQWYANVDRIFEEGQTSFSPDEISKLIKNFGQQLDEGTKQLVIKELGNAKEALAAMNRLSSSPDAMLKSIGFDAMSKESSKIFQVFDSSKIVKATDIELSGEQLKQFLDLYAKEGVPGVQSFIAKLQEMNNAIDEQATESKRAFSTEEIDNLNNHISELESSIVRTKSEISSMEDSLSHDQKKDAFPDKDISASVESATNSIKEENNVLEQNTQKVKENTQAKEQNANANLNKYDKRLDSYNGKVGKYQATINRFNDGGWTSDTYLKNVQAVRDAVKQYATLLDNIKTNQNGIASDEDIQNLDKYEKKIKDTIATVTNMSASEKGYTKLAGQKEIDKINQILRENSAMSSEAKAKIKAYKQELISGNPSVSLEKIHGEIMKIVNAEELAGRAGKSFFDTLKNSGFHQLAAQMAGMFGFYDVINLGKEGLSVVRELNTALTEMRKVSDESLQSLKNYQNTTFDTADAVGTTAKQIQTSTADYMRLGESLDKAAESAKTANVLLNVSEFDNIEDATKSLVAMGQAYKDLDKMTIVDKLNEVGKIVAQTYSNVWCYKNIAW